MVRCNRRVGSRPFWQTGTRAPTVTAALIGRAVEQNSNRGGQGVYRVTVQMEDGGTRSFDYAEPPNVQVGERVRVDGNQLYR